MDEYIKKSEAVDVIVKYPYDIAGKTATAIKMIEDLPSADVVPRSEVSILTVQNMALENTKSELQHELNKYKGVENILKDNMGELIMAAIVQAKQEFASEIFAEIEKEIDRGLSVIEKILNTKGGRANGKTVLISKYDVYVEAKKYIAELKKKYTEGEDKPATEEKHFSPEDVSKMIPQEVREKYSAIRRSMERW